jgi:transposase
MLSSSIPNQVYLACGSTDMRKSIDGLAAMVTFRFKLDVFSESMFVFCNRSRNKVKILLWERNGFWLYYRRLETGRFKWPEQDETGAISISRRQLGWLLEGLSLEQHQAHREVLARKVA